MPGLSGLIVRRKDGMERIGGDTIPLRLTGFATKPGRRGSWAAQNLETWTNKGSRWGEGGGQVLGPSDKLNVFETRDIERPSCAPMPRAFFRTMRMDNPGTPHF